MTSRIALRFIRATVIDLMMDADGWGLLMPLQLHEKCKTHLCERLSEILSKADVEHGRYLKGDTLYDLFDLEKSLPADSKFREKLLSYVGENSLFEYVYCSLRNELEGKDYKEDIGPQRLSKLDGFENVAAISKKLIDGFDSLPWKYVVTFPLPRLISDMLSKLPSGAQVFPAVKIVTVSDEFNRFFPPEADERGKHSEIARLLAGEDAPYKALRSIGRRYIQVEVEGFVGGSNVAPPIFYATNLYKSFFGLLIANRVFEVSSIKQGSLETFGFEIHKYDGEKWIWHAAHHVESDVSSALERLRLRDFGQKIDKDALLKHVFDDFVSVKRAISNWRKARSVILAAQWLFDSFTSKNEMLAFIQAIVVLEILLGDDAAPEDIGLTQLLRNRCAFLIGRSHEQREKILEDFSRIYRVRSQIVHRGKSKLVGEEKYLFVQLQWICMRAIQEEIRLLGADEVMALSEH